MSWGPGFGFEPACLLKGRESPEAKPCSRRRFCVKTLELSAGQGQDRGRTGEAALRRESGIDRERRKQREKRRRVQSKESETKWVVSVFGFGCCPKDGMNAPRIQFDCESGSMSIRMQDPHPTIFGLDAPNPTPSPILTSRGEPCKGHLG